MSYFHGSANHRFEVGEIIRPGREVGKWANWTAFEEMTRRRLASGRVVHPRDVVWLTPFASEAENWAGHSLLKATGAEIRQMGGGIGVYEVDPVGLDRPLAEHGEGEACCVRAIVLREVSFEAFALDRCDQCGETASVGIGSDWQLCAQCAADEAAA